MNRGVTEPSVHVATSLPAWAVREGMLETGWKAQSRGHGGVYPAHHLEKRVPQDQKRREHELQLQAGLQQPPPHFQTQGNLFPWSKAKFFLIHKYKKTYKAAMRNKWSYYEDLFKRQGQVIEMILSPPS